MSDLWMQWCLWAKRFLQRPLIITKSIFISNFFFTLDLFYGYKSATVLLVNMYFTEPERPQILVLTREDYRSSADKDKYWRSLKEAKRENKTKDKTNLRRTLYCGKWLL